MPDTAGLRSLGEFLDWERRQPDRYELLDGIVRLMTGGSIAHGKISGNLYLQLRLKLAGSPCTALQNSVKVIAAGSSFYPDVVVTCSATEDKNDVLPDPVVVFEVLSPTTAAIDSGRKKLRCFRIPSLRHYVLVEQDEPRIEIYSRDGELWTVRGVEGIEASVDLPAISVSLPLASFYEGIAFSAGNPV